MDTVFPQANFIIIERRDVIAQAVSWAFSLKTSAWSSGEKVNEEAPKYDESLIMNCLNKVLNGYAGWKLYTAVKKRKNPSLKIQNFFYEDIISDRGKILSSVLNLIEGNNYKKTDDIIQKSIEKNFSKPHTHLLKAEWLTKFSKNFECQNHLKIAT